MCDREHSHRHRHGFRFRGRRMPSRDELLKALEDRQKDLEEEIADIHDLLRRLREEGTAPRAEPVTSI
jgi:hypothetical protein